jgi:N-methylhydantoinase A
VAFRIGIDTGGTFTDLIGIDDATGQLVVAKTPSTPQRPVDALVEALHASGIPPHANASLCIGTTVATNALLMRSGANVLYVTTAGFEDIPYIQRMNRKHHFSLKWTKPEPLVERRHCLGVRERLDFHGNVVTPLTDEALEELARQIECRISEYPEGSVAIAVCLLFSYVNPEHELRARAFLEERFPEIPVSLSHEVAPIWREYERGSTVIADAYIKPIVQGYAGGIAEALEAESLDAPWSLMKSNGGTTTAERAIAEPIKLLLSGLAGGIIAGHHVGQQLGLDNVVTLDMGGTSCDVGLISKGKIGYSTDFEIEFGLPVATPTIDLTTIGAGGGSIAWIDKGGFLRVGPQSAGADPGPVCYGAGGTEPTVTDANLVLGRLDPGYFLGGQIALDAEKARGALTDLGARLGLDPHAAAQAVIDIANENMANAIRVLSIDRGLDPREYALVAFGGAGPLHAADIAVKIGMTTVVVPVYPGVTSALGAMIAEPKVNRVWSRHFRSDAIDATLVREHFAGMTAAVLDELREEGAGDHAIVERSISMRYWGQNYEQDVPVPEGQIDDAVLNAALERFHRLHEQFYGYSISGEVIELIRFSVEARSKAPAFMMPALTTGDEPPQTIARPVYFHGHGLIDCAIARREELPAGFRAEGPMIVEEVVSTTLVPPGAALEVHPGGSLIVSMRHPKS